MALVLTLVPLRTVVAQEQRVASYLVSVPSHGFGSVPINHGLLGLCNAGFPELRLVGNQTIWLEWKVVGGADLDYANLFATLGGTPLVLYNESDVAAGGFAESSANELEYVCDSNPIFGAYANSSLSLLVQVGLIYGHTASAPLI